MNHLISFIILFLFTLLCISNSQVVDYSLAIGRDLNSPADIPRATFSSINQMNQITDEFKDDVYNITLSKYYLNSIVSLSTNNSFGAISHYNSLVNLFSNINNLTKINLIQAYNDINNLKKFTTNDQNVYIQAYTYWNNTQSNIESLRTTINGLKTAIELTKNNMLVNVPNVDTYKVVVNDYMMVLSALSSLNTRFNKIQLTIDTIKSSIFFFKQSYTYYVANLITQQEYMTSMNNAMLSLLTSLNEFYSRTFLISRLI
ncbi:hypothetical protein RB653_000621 [Dictyostelium firmibasis]|uniref:Uncharacterized protein n=1 Tax=Dictyostelium firmibasis TaxID=79012 RepID=A0AAN7TVF7_9MYCE